MLPLITQNFKLTTFLKKKPDFVQQGSPFKKKLKYKYSKKNYFFVDSFEPLPLIPVISFVRAKTGSKPELRFKYIWGWRRSRQNHVFMTKLGLNNVSLLGAFYF